MSDLVTRLRGDVGRAVPTVMIEAADEIERLRSVIVDRQLNEIDSLQQEVERLRKESDGLIELLRREKVAVERLELRVAELKLALLAALEENK